MTTDSVTFNTAIGVTALASANPSGSLKNTAMGYQALNGLTTGGSCTAVGASALSANITGSSNTVMGVGSLDANIWGDFNVAIGDNALGTVVTGTNNIGIGSFAGNGLIGNNSSNICIGSTGVAADNNTLRIGAATGTGAGQLNSAFISGIYGVTATSADQMVVMNSSNQLGTQAISSGGITGSESFRAYLNTTQSNATGDGTTVNPVPFDTTEVNTNSNFNTGTGVWTCPATGLYSMSVSIYITGTSTGCSNFQFTLVETGGSSYQLAAINYENVVITGGALQFNTNVVALLTSGRTSQISLTGHFGTKTLTIASGLGFTWWSGYRIT